MPPTARTQPPWSHLSFQDFEQWPFEEFCAQMSIELLSPDWEDPIPHHI